MLDAAQKAITFETAASPDQSPRRLERASYAVKLTTLLPAAPMLRRNLQFSVETASKTATELPVRLELLARASHALDPKFERAWNTDVVSDCVNERVTKCMNCDAIGTHDTRSCPEPKDWSRVKCKHCGKMGHASAARCRPEDREAFAAAQAEKDGAVRFETEDAGSGGASSWNAKNDSKTIASRQASWETETVADAVAVGGSW